MCFFKPELLVKFEYNNMSNNVIIDKKYWEMSCNKKDIGIILAGGYSTRFKSTTPKQLYELNGKPILIHSVEAIKNYVYKLIIVTNSSSYDTIRNILSSYKNVSIVINDIDCRLESIYTGLNAAKKYKGTRNVIIHDSARPYLSESYIKTLIELSTQYKYVQYAMKLVNGLHKLDAANYEIVDREHYRELFTPLLIDYELCKFIYENYMSKDKRIVWEFINILDLLRIDYKLIEGDQKYLRKITVINDLT